MSQAALTDAPHSFTGVESRRSTRIECSIPLTIIGQDALGQPFQEKTSAITLNLHGCRYPSRHDCNVGTWLMIAVGEAPRGTIPKTARAQVKSVHLPTSPRELHQVGIELEVPANIWGISAPPKDWESLLGMGLPSAISSTAVKPANEPLVMNLKPVEEQSAPLHEVSASTVVTMPAPPAPADVASTVVQPAPSKPTRTVITADALVSALRGKLQHAAEQAVQSAIKTHLEPAVRTALANMDRIRQSSIKQIEDTFALHSQTLQRSKETEVSSEVVSRLGERIESWERQIEMHRGRAEEIGQRMEKLAAAGRHDLIRTQELVEKSVSGVEQNLSRILDEACAQASGRFQGAAAQAADRQLVRLKEESQSLMRQVSSQLEARAAEARAAIHTAATSALEEFYRQTEVHADLLTSETHQRVSSALAALDAESRAACEARRKMLESEVARTAEQQSEQFRQSLKTFFYSCLVAAVGAVEQHSQTTLRGLSPDTKDPLLNADRPSAISEDQVEPKDSAEPAPE